MPLEYQSNGRLTPNVHLVSWQEFVDEFGNNNHRKRLLEGIKKALNILKQYGCERVYIDGSFVTKKQFPGDWDGCYDRIGMEEYKMRTEVPAFKKFVHPRQQQKVLFKGEIMPSDLEVDAEGKTILDFFKYDTREEIEKGIIELSLKNFVP